MEKEFVPYSEALALKELGFEEKCLANYLSTKELSISFWRHGYDTPAPLYQQCFKWFREKYKMQAEILWRGDMGCFCYKTGKFKYGEHAFSKDDYKTYEEAELECLKKLIEIVKEK